MGIFTGKKKVDKVEHLRKRYQADIILGCEHQCDFRYADNDSQFKNLFAMGEEKRACVGHNTTVTKEDSVQDQKGGTALMTFGRMTAHVIDAKVDYTGMGRCFS